MEWLAIFFFSILFFTNIGAIIAQNNVNKYDKWVTYYPSNIDLPFSKSELNKLEEAYDQNLNDFIIDINPNFIDIFGKELKKYLAGLKKSD